MDWRVIIFIGVVAFIWTSGALFDKWYDEDRGEKSKFGFFIALICALMSIGVGFVFFFLTW